MSRVLSYLLGIAGPICLVAPAILADEPGRVTGISTYQHSSSTVGGKAAGFCGLSAIEIDDRPTAAFGLYQPPGGKPLYTYLVLFKNARAGSNVGVEGEGTAVIDSAGEIDCDFNLACTIGKKEIRLGLRLERDPKTVTKQVVRIGGKDYGPDGPRVFLVDLADPKLIPLAITYTPVVAPDFADEDAWGRQILAAKKELIEQSPEAARFFAKE